MPDEKITKTDAEWKAQLSPAQYAVLREQATERPFTGIYNDFNEPGVFRCAGCGAELFRSETKFNAGCGWPSFSEQSAANVEERVDHSHGVTRTEVVCKNCGGHLGHVFPDGPKPTGLRYCINSLSLDFDPKDEAAP